MPRPHALPPARTIAHHPRLSLPPTGLCPLAALPQDRLLSGFLDKMQLQRKADRAPAHFLPGGTFEEFVRNLTSLERPRLADIHFRPASRQCGLPFGMRYDYALKVEEMAQWYEPLVRLLGLETTVQSGWNRTTKWWRGSGECFYAPPRRSCSDMFATPWGCADGQTAGDAGVRPASFHATGAAARRSHFGAAARLATRWLREDLERLATTASPATRTRTRARRARTTRGGRRRWRWCGYGRGREESRGGEEDDDDDDGPQGKDEASEGSGGGGGGGRPATKRSWWLW